MDEHGTKGIKRKRATSSREDDTAGRIKGKLHHCLREVKQAAKKAKTFDTQKLVKKLKHLREKDGDTSTIADLERQLESLKNLDTNLAACTALKTKINKDRLLSENADVQAAVAAEVASQSLESALAGSSASKVQSRLLSSKILAAAISAAVDSMKIILQPEEPDNALESDEEEEEEEDDPLPPRKKAKLPPQRPPGDSDDDLEGEGGDLLTISDDDESVNDAGWESGSVAGSALAEDDEGSESESDSAEHLEESASESDSNLESIRASRSHIQTRAKPTPRETKTKSTITKSSESTFLPSLAVGFTRGDSDSEWSDSEAKIVDGDSKKNRRGQRARRAIWEKKFGKNANHVKKQRETATIRDAYSSRRGKDSRPAPRAQHNSQLNRKPSTSFGQGGARYPGAYRQSRPPVHAPSGSALATAGPGSNPRSTQERPMHPSWEAKRKQKAKEQFGIVRSVGTKIKF